MIELVNVTKVHGSQVAVDGLSFVVRPGVVTGFLGPNGAGKSTTMRLILGLDHPTSGQALVNGRPYKNLAAPLREVGALLEARAVHPARSAANHLRVMAATHGFPSSRTDEMLELVGLRTAAPAPAGTLSLGMGQRLGIAAALLGDPRIIVLDEPSNGLDPEGIRWVRSLLRNLANEGRTVFVSSHQMSEMALTADHLVIIHHGKLLADMSMAEFVDVNTSPAVQVTTPDATKLTQVLAGAGVTITRHSSDSLEVIGLSASDIGEAASRAGITLYDLSSSRSSLEDAFMRMTGDGHDDRPHSSEHETSREGTAA